MTRLVLAAPLFVLAACTTEFDADFNQEAIDFGTYEWAQGPPTETESVFLVNDGSDAFWIHELDIIGDDAAAFTAVAAREDFELPFAIAGGVGTEIILRFVGGPEEAQETFEATLDVSIGPPRRGARSRASLGLPLTIFLTCDADGDGDDYPDCGGGDCDDHDPDLASTLPELCNGVDDDCINGPDADPGGEVDLDFDGFRTCEDCDDDNPFINPDASEACDGVDNDCNGSADAAGGEGDADNDGTLACNDCDDNDETIGPFDCR